MEDTCRIRAMLAHILRITAVTACGVLCTFLPFLPGRYDNVAVPLSRMSQIFAKVGLLLVPVGAVWVASGYWSRGTRQYAIAVVALVTSSVVWALLSLVALAASKMDLLQLTAEELALEQSRGHYAVHDAPHPHWRYFRFD